MSITRNERLADRLYANALRLGASLSRRAELAREEAMTLDGGKVGPRTEQLESTVDTMGDKVFALVGAITRGDAAAGEAAVDAVVARLGEDQVERIGKFWESDHEGLTARWHAAGVRQAVDAIVRVDHGSPEANATVKSMAEGIMASLDDARASINALVPARVWPPRLGV